MLLLLLLLLLLHGTSRFKYTSCEPGGLLLLALLRVMLLRLLLIWLLGVLC